MPAPDEPDTYEAFVVETRDAKARVVAIVRSHGRTQTREFARAGDANHAARLADALNSRLLCRRNHSTRLRAELAGLPLDVHAAARDIPVGDAHASDVPLADHLCGDPVDGLLLFPITPGPLTPWAAYLIALGAEVVGDLCHHVAQSAHLHAIRFLLPRLPPRLRRERADHLLGVATELDRLAAAPGRTPTRHRHNPETTRPGAGTGSRGTAVQDHTEIAAGTYDTLSADSHNLDFTAQRQALLPATLSGRPHG